MRRLIALLLLLSFATLSWSQSLDLRGTYKNQTFKAKGRYRPDGSVEITSFSYPPYDKLDGEVKTLKAQKKALEDEKAMLEKKLRGNPDCGDEVARQTASLRREISRLNKSLDSVSAILNNRANTGDELAELRRQIQDSAAAHRNAIGRYNTELTLKNKKIAELEIRCKGKGLNANTVNVELLYGSSDIKNNLTKQDFWKRPFSPSIQVMAAYTYYFDKQSPFAVKAGVGFASYKGNNSVELVLDTVKGLTDDDGDNYEARFSYSGIEESLTLNYLEIPILFHVGNSFLTNGVQAWIEAGVKAGFNVGNNFEGKGIYTCEGYYPQWNATLGDVEALGFVSNAPAFPDGVSVEPKTFVLWGVVAAGMNIPLSEKIALLVGAQCGYTLTPIASGESTENHISLGKPSITSGESTRIFNLGAKLGIVINL